MDRNQAAINGFKQRHKVEEFRAALRDGRVAVPDQFHRPIIQGDIVHVGTPNARFWRVQDVTPELSPNVPPGTMRVTLSGVMSFFCGAGHALDGITLVVPQEIAMAEDEDAAMSRAIAQDENDAAEAHAAEEAFQRSDTPDGEPS